MMMEKMECVDVMEKVGYGIKKILGKTGYVLRKGMMALVYAGEIVFTGLFIVFLTALMVADLTTEMMQQATQEREGAR